MREWRENSELSVGEWQLLRSITERGETLPGPSKSPRAELENTEDRASFP